MKLLKILIIPKYRIFTIVILLLLLVAYAIIRTLYFETDPVARFLSSFANSYLLQVEMFANKLLSLTGSEVRIANHILTINGVKLVGFIPQIRFKSFMALFLILVWITKTTLVRKVSFSLLLLTVHFIIGSIILTAGAHLSEFKEYDDTLLSIPITLGLIILFTILFFWYKKHKKMILLSLSRLRINTERFQKDYQVIMVAYIFILLYYFLYDIFDYHNWINFLFTSSQIILGMFGYVATVEPNYLIGDNGSIFMLKPCLGYQTMLLFAAIVFLTGSTGKGVRWIYIISGLLLLNFANIMRFVFLFIHIQKHGDYELAMDVHEMYNYIIYSIVFILWVIWFEKFADYQRKSA